MKYYAHSLSGRDPIEWQSLEDHLWGVARKAADFARPFRGEEWAFLAGLWHDLGKYSNEFQAMLFRENGIEAHIETQPGRVVHSEAGAHLACRKGWRGVDRVLSWLIMGHHTGLLDYDEAGGKSLKVKMEAADRSDAILRAVPPEITEQPPPKTAFPKGADPAFFIRMLFSCLVDADFLDTEVFMDMKRAELRSIGWPTLAELGPALDRHMQGLCALTCEKPINQLRHEVLEMCRRKADSPPGVFTLSVPTGGGKTLASLSFAMRHALHHGKQRIIYVIPYTSIVEQTADWFRGISGFEKAVLEHHSNLVDEDETKESVRGRLASENWDAPLVVTTSVQFFESLHAARTSPCRKLHHIANSVVILDEAQCLPPEYLRTCVHSLRELVRHYGVSLLLCTATQPVLTQTKSFDFSFTEGFDAVTEIVENPALLAEKLRRTRVRLHEKGLQSLTLDEVAGGIQSENASVLCIVNRKEDCRALALRLPKDRTYHLSTNMCAAHRKEVLDRVRLRLAESDPAYLISTSLIEAGVDIDFPVVYRALAGLDSIAQAAGRCNREDKLAHPGKVVVFLPEKQPAYVRSPADIARGFFDPYGGLDIHSPDAFTRYFRERYWQLGSERLDARGIRALLSGAPLEYSFRSAADRFRFVDDEWQVPVIVPYGNSSEIIGKLSEGFGGERRLLRQLQRFSVQVEKALHDRLEREGCIEATQWMPGLYLLNECLYDPFVGFLPPEEAMGRRNGAIIA